MTPSTALVSGAASGIGAALAERLEQHGVEVRRLDLAGGFDVGDPRSWETVPAVGLACLNAGVGTGQAQLVELSDANYRRVMGANLDGVVLGARRMARVMRPGGIIVVTASLAGLVPLADDPIYTASKHAVVGFVRAVAPQLEARGIRICAVAPGMVDTPLIAASRELLGKAGYPLLRPAEVVDAVMRLVAEGGPGEVWVVQPGREPEPMRVPRVPGARDPNGASAGAPPSTAHLPARGSLVSRDQPKR